MLGILLLPDVDLVGLELFEVYVFSVRVIASVSVGVMTAGCIRVGHDCRCFSGARGRWGALQARASVELFRAFGADMIGTASCVVQCCGL